MTALTDKLARLRADLAAATPWPLVLESSETLYITDKYNETDGIAVHFELPDPNESAANARAHVGAVNAAPTLIDVVEAAIEFRAAVDAEPSSAEALRRFRAARDAMFAALDRAEAEAAR